MSIQEKRYCRKCGLSEAYHTILLACTFEPEELIEFEVRECTCGSKKDCLCEGREELSEETLAKVKQGLRESAMGLTKYLGSFAKFAKGEEDEEE